MSDRSPRSRRALTGAILTGAGLAVAIGWALIVLPVLGLAGFGPGARRPMIVFALLPPAIASALLIVGGIIGATGDYAATVRWAWLRKTMYAVAAIAGVALGGYIVLWYVVVA